MTREEQIRKAYETLHQFVNSLAEAAGENREYADELWERIRCSNGVLRELAYYHDNGSFLGEYKVAGYSLVDILVWQVDHFKAYLDRREEVNRYRQERLFLKSLDILLEMEKDPTPYVAKMSSESGTDIVNG
ncbi:MAG: hypothetical protein IJ833_10295 [Lachnospiraceae bacterium]|nr:hypothetical protein [Lachnospiraceae bacterium]